MDPVGLWVGDGRICNREGHEMALTALVKQELSRLEFKNSSVRKAEVSAFLRFADGLHVLPGRFMVQVEVELVSTARRLQAAIADLYGHQGEVLRIPAQRVHAGGRYILRVVRGSELLARQAGLLDGRGRPVRGLPPAVLNGSSSDAEAVWRGAFLSQGSLKEQGRSSLLSVTCPAPEAALALVGAARRLGVEVKAREVRGVERVTIRDHDDIAVLLTRMGAAATLSHWQKHRAGSIQSDPANRIVNFDSSNSQRSTQAAQLTCTRVERALEILGDDVSERLKYAGELRLAHRQASLEELGRLADPRMSKDTIAGRIRRLLVAADKRALLLGLPAQLTD